MLQWVSKCGVQHEHCPWRTLHWNEQHMPHGNGEHYFGMNNKGCNFGLTMSDKFYVQCWMMRVNMVCSPRTVQPYCSNTTTVMSFPKLKVLNHVSDKICNIGFVCLCKVHVTWLGFVWRCDRTSNHSSRRCVKNWSNYVAQYAWTNFKHNLGPAFNTTLFAFSFSGLKPHFCIFCINCKL